MAKVEGVVCETVQYLNFEIITHFRTKMHPHFILIVSILSFAMAQISTNKKTIFSFNTDAGVKYWPSDSTKQDMQYINVNTNYQHVNLKRFDFPVVLSKEYSLNLESLFMNGTLELQNIDVEFDLKLVFDFDKKYQPFRDWGNASTPVTDAELNGAVNRALKSGKEVKSVTFDSAKGIRSGFETLCAFNKAVYAQRWIGSFGGKITGGFQLLPFGSNASLNFSSIKMVTLKGPTLRIAADKAVFDLVTDVVKVDSLFSTATVKQGSLALEGHAGSPKPTNTVTPSAGGSNNNAVGGNSTQPSGAYSNFYKLWTSAIIGWMFLSL
ncbi:hypothetical protein HDV02_000530 [Globomyces sp. JEL0801]|nr:hypothetical protein HDV02_000530 [Globomyces sp. JEL0801]